MKSRGMSQERFFVYFALGFIGVFVLLIGASIIKGSENEKTLKTAGGDIDLNLIQKATAAFSKVDVNKVIEENKLVFDDDPLPLDTDKDNVSDSEDIDMDGDGLFNSKDPDANGDGVLEREPSTICVQEFGAGWMCETNLICGEGNQEVSYKEGLWCNSRASDGKKQCAKCGIPFVCEPPKCQMNKDCYNNGYVLNNLVCNNSVWDPIPKVDLTGYFKFNLYPTDDGCILSSGVVDRPYNLCAQANALKAYLKFDIPFELSKIKGANLIIWKNDARPMKLKLYKISDYEDLGAEDWNVSKQFIADIPQILASFSLDVSNYIDSQTVAFLVEANDYPSSQSCFYSSRAGENARPKLQLLSETELILDSPDGEDNPASCDDGISNGDETGIDCGGSCSLCDDNLLVWFDFSSMDTGSGGATPNSVYPGDSTKKGATKEIRANTPTGVSPLINTLTELVNDSEKGSVLHSSDKIIITTTAGMNKPLTSKKFTVETWVKFENLNGWYSAGKANSGTWKDRQTIFSVKEDYWYETDTVTLQLVDQNTQRLPNAENHACLQGMIVTKNGTKSVKSTSCDFESNKWYHLALVSDGSKLKLYIDKELDSEVDVSDLPERKLYAINIGSQLSYRVPPVKLYNYFKGWMDDFKIYNSANEVF